MKQFTQGHTDTKWQLGAEVGGDLNCVDQQKVEEPGGLLWSGRGRSS